MRREALKYRTSTTFESPFTYQYVINLVVFSYQGNPIVFMDVVIWAHYTLDNYVFYVA